VLRLHRPAGAGDQGLRRLRFGDTAVSGSIGFPSFASATSLVSSRSAGAIVSGTGPNQCASTPPPFITCFTVEVRNAAGTAIDGNFTIAVL